MGASVRVLMTRSQDLARIDLKKDTLEKSVDQLTIAIAKNPAGGGMFKICGKTRNIPRRSPCPNNNFHTISK